MKSLLIIITSSIAMMLPQLASANYNQYDWNNNSNYAAGEIFEDALNGVLSIRHHNNRGWRHRGPRRRGGWGRGGRRHGRWVCSTEVNSRRGYFSGRARGPNRYNVRERAIRRCQRQVRNNVYRPRRARRLMRRCAQNTFCERRGPRRF